MQLLAERFARGEIDHEEFERRRDVLGRRWQSPPATAAHPSERASRMSRDRSEQQPDAGAARARR
ncbi:MAG TPA: SHOCT domain-containing protein [Streptomyces sp.]|nr:SHOCT domain-containing protein [Streptomyces sp.]